MRVAALGANAWLVVAVWPVWSTAAVLDDTALGALVLAASALAAGVVALARHARTLAAWLLSCAFPALVVAGLCTRPEAFNAEAFDATALALGLASLLAYGAGAAQAVAETPRSLATHHVPLPDASSATASSRESLLRKIVVVISVAGAAAIAIEAPTRGGFDALRRDWGDAAIEGGLLTAVVGSAVAVSIVAVFLPDALRRGRAPEDTSRDRMRRAGVSLVAATLGAVVWLVLRP